ncbi:hypothetical protein Csa_014021 [Cucumis sativus]|uniref:Serine-threonine/tyrosine-protein kinase catalytic domain-containing protein n=1 Tax=Cucumis sativus TaxID=3659 RepID=A0A0A0LS45_CUCSA|nr:hypothetical protein Csa_014021 [Cucumis sativus]
MPISVVIILAVSRVSRLTLPPTPPSHDLLPVSSPSLSPHTTTHVKEKKSKRLKTVVIIVLPVVVVLVVLIVSIIIFLRARKRRDEVASLEVDDTASLETLAFDIATIRTATNDFSSENCVGDSEHGVVYKGSLVNGQEIAVKRLFDHDSKSEDSVWRNWRAGTALNVVDPILKDGPTNEIMKCMNIGLLCAQQIKSDRPTMETVLLMLNSDKITRPIISPPDYYMNKFRITRSEFSSSPKRSGSHVIEIE